MRVLITGATGTLGREIARLSTLAGHSVVGLSHRVRSPKFRDAGWVLGDLETGEGLRVAVGDVDAIIHAATDPARHAEVDAAGTARLVRAAREGRVRHFVHVSMAGVDDIPLAYYKSKRMAEQIVMGGGLPYSILRVTQFHHAVERQLQRLASVPLVLPLPKAFVVQSVDVREVAARLVRCLDERPRGRLADFGGPHVLPLAEAASVWMRMNGVQKRIVHVPVPGVAASAFRAQMNTAPFGVRGKVSWREWLLRRDTMRPIDSAESGEEPQRLEVRKVS
jgi:uncharacterized protein YbjT (DUF2867 family)